jgi:hypothetical protein
MGSIPEEIADEGIGVRGAKSLRIPLRPLSPLRVAVIGLADTGNDACQQEGPRIDFTSEEKLKLLPWRERKSAPIACGVEDRHHARDALVLLLLELLLGLLVLAFFAVRLGGRSLGTGAVLGLRIGPHCRGNCELRLRGFGELCGRGQNRTRARFLCGRQGRQGCQDEARSQCCSKTADCREHPFPSL